MGRRKATASSAVSVPVLLNECQRASASGHLRYAKALWGLVDENGKETLDEIIHGMKLFMTVAEKNIYQERILRFLATFANEVDSQARLDFVEAMLQALVLLSNAKDPTARWRACQLVHCLMGSLPADAAISDEVADSIQSAMLACLDDPKPTVRAAAARALARLPIPDDDGDFTECPVTDALLELLASERSKDVRKAVLASLPAAPCTRSAILDRTRDESDDVRRITYLAIAEKMPLDQLGTQAGAFLVRRGLSDRSTPVSQAADVMVTAWLDGACNGEPLALLRWIDPVANPKEAEAALQVLVASGRLSAVQIGKLAAEENLGLRADYASEDARLMTPEEALFWRVVCESLISEATTKGLAAAATAGAAANIEAAAAGDRLEALEAALPASTKEVVDLIALHAAGGADASFACAQLMTLASRCVDFTDSSGRRAAAELLENLLVSSWSSAFQDMPSGNAAATTGISPAAWVEAAGLLMRKVHATHAELADAVLSILSSLNGQFDFSAQLEGTPDAVWRHALMVAGIMLEALPSTRPALNAATSFSLQDLIHGLVEPALGHGDTRVRQEALRCLGLYCLLDGTPTVLAAHLPTFRSRAVSEDEPVQCRTIAIQALGDLALQRGPKALDALLLANTEDATPSEPLIDLFANVLREWQEVFATMAGSKRLRRRRGKISTEPPPEGESIESLGTAVVESLVRLVAVNEFRQAADERKGEVSALEDSEVLKLLVSLLMLQFDKRTEPAACLRQCLTVFFERFSGLSLTSQQYLATALLPAARCATAEDMAAGRRTATSNPMGPQVIRFVLQLLQVPVIGTDGRREPLGHEPLAELVLGEILSCAQRSGVPKPYLATLCKLPLALPMYDAGSDTRATMVRIQVYAFRAYELLTDKAMQKDMEATVARYAAPFGTGKPELSEEDVTALLAGVKAHVEAFCAGFPVPFDDEDGDAAANAGGATVRRPAPGRGRAHAPARRGDASVDESVDMDDDSDEDDQTSKQVVRGRQPTRRVPARVTRAKKNMAESEDEDDAVCKLEMPPADSTSEEEEVDGDGEEEEERWERENLPQPSASKARRASAASVAALREALRENAKIS